MHLVANNKPIRNGKEISNLSKCISMRRYHAERRASFVATRSDDEPHCFHTTATLFTTARQHGHVLYFPTLTMVTTFAVEPFVLSLLVIIVYPPCQSPPIAAAAAALIHMHAPVGTCRR